MPETRSIVPDKGIRAGKNSSGAEIARNVFVRVVPGGTTDPTQISLPALGGPVYGVNVAGGVSTSGEFGLPNGHIGDVQSEGRARVKASAAVAVGANISTTAAGLAKTAAVGEIVVGRSVTAAAALNDLLEVELAGAAQSFIQP
jgi:hypothetical protein